MNIQATRTNTTPDTAWSTGDGGATATVSADPATTLAASGDIGAEMATMVVESSRDTHDAARAERHSQEVLAQQQDARAVQQLHDEAADMRWQGVADAATTICAAACHSSSNTTGEATCKAIGSLGDAAFNAAEKDDEANATTFKSIAAQDRSNADDDRDTANDATDTAKAALSFFQQYTSTDAQTQAAILHRA